MSIQAQARVAVGRAAGMSQHDRAVRRARECLREGRAACGAAYALSPEDWDYILAGPAHISRADRERAVRWYLGR